MTVNLCDYSIARHRTLLWWRGLWTLLLFAFGAAVVVFLCISIILFNHTAWLAGAASTVGTIASGAAVKWVVDRRREAVDEEEKAYLDVKTECADTKPADVARLAIRLF